MFALVTKNPPTEAIFEMLYKRSTGADAHRDVLIVFYKHEGTGSLDAKVYKAWKVDSLVTINQLDSVNENIDFDLALNDIVEGAVSVGSGVVVSFEKGTWDGYTFTAKQ